MNNEKKYRQYGYRLAEVRTKAGLMQKEVAKHLGVKDNVISYFENGDRLPSVEQYKELSKLFNVSADYLLGLATDFTTDDELKFVCNYTGLSADAVNKLKGNSQKLTIQAELCPNDEVFTNSPSKTLDLFDKCKSDFISSDDFCNILICILFDKLLIEDLKELKHKVENDEFSEEFEKVRLYSRVVNWNNEHRLNLFNAQDSLISFMKEYNDFEDIDFNYYRELIEAISNVYPSYSNDERESISKQDMSYLEQFLNDETTVDGDINGNDN